VKHCDHQHNHGEKNQREFFNELANSWDNISIHDLTKVDYIISLLGLKGDERIMDVGTGTGILIPFYEKYLTSGSVLAVDFSKEMISRCKEKYPEAEHPLVRFEVTDVYDTAYEKEFDVVTCYSCFPHFNDHQKVVDILSRSLNPGGKFMIAHSSSRDHINHVHRHGGSDIHDDVLPTLEELSILFTKSELHILFERSDEDYHIIIAEKPLTSRDIF
jgi:Methylase involved in ubiquinone/menaquinone biosynthesis